MCVDARLTDARDSRSEATLPQRAHGLAPRVHMTRLHEQHQLVAEHHGVQESRVNMGSILMCTESRIRGCYLSISED